MEKIAKSFPERLWLFYSKNIISTNTYTEWHSLAHKKIITCIKVRKSKFQESLIAMQNVTVPNMPLKVPISVKQGFLEAIF